MFANIAKLRMLHEQYGKHKMGVVCPICYCNMKNILEEARISAMELLETGLPLKFEYLDKIRKEVDDSMMERIPYIIAWDSNTYVNFLKAYPHIKNKLYLWFFDENEAKTLIKSRIGISVDKVICFKYYNENIASIDYIHKILLNIPKDFIFPNSIKITKYTINQFLETPGAFFQSIVPLEIYKQLIQDDKKYFSYLFPKSMGLIKCPNLITSDMREHLDHIVNNIRYIPKWGTPYDYIFNFFSNEGFKVMSEWEKEILKRIYNKSNSDMELIEKESVCYDIPIKYEGGKGYLGVWNNKFTLGRSRKSNTKELIECPQKIEF